MKGIYDDLSRARAPVYFRCSMSDCENQKCAELVSRITNVLGQRSLEILKLEQQRDQLLQQVANQSSVQPTGTISNTEHTRIVTELRTRLEQSLNEQRDTVERLKRVRAEFEALRERFQQQQSHNNTATKFVDDVNVDDGDPSGDDTVVVAESSTNVPAISSSTTSTISVTAPKPKQPTSKLLRSAKVHQKNVTKQRNAQVLLCCMTCT
jgi:hypothetical protein